MRRYGRQVEGVVSPFYYHLVTMHYFKIIKKRKNMDFSFKLLFYKTIL